MYESVSCQAMYSINSTGARQPSGAERSPEALTLLRVSVPMAAASVRVLVLMLNVDTTASRSVRCHMAPLWSPLLVVRGTNHLLVDRGIWLPRRATRPCYMVSHQCLKSSSTFHTFLSVAGWGVGEGGCTTRRRTACRSCGCSPWTSPAGRGDSCRPNQGISHCRGTNTTTVNGVIPHFAGLDEDTSGHDAA